MLADQLVYMIGQCSKYELSETVSDHAHTHEYAIPTDCTCLPAVVPAVLRGSTGVLRPAPESPPSRRHSVEEFRPAFAFRFERVGGSRACTLGPASYVRFGLLMDLWHRHIIASTNFNYIPDAN